MKNNRIICILLFLVFIPLQITAQSKKMDQFTIQVDGLGCPFCAFGLEKKFKEFKGIKKVKIDIETGIFTFNYPSEKALSLTDVEQQVEKAGYTPITAKIVRADGEVEVSEAKKAVVNSKTNQQKVSIKVAGNCGMCKARIEKAAAIEGVISAIWNKDSKILVLNFDKNITSQKKVEKAIAKAGHDTENLKAKKSTYDELPGCCHYERIN